MSAKVVNVDRCLFASDDLAELLLIEHSEPFGIDDLGQTVKEGSRLSGDLSIKLELADELDVWGDISIQSDLDEDATDIRGGFPRSQRSPSLQGRARPSPSYQTLPLISAL